jgi:indole-3-glycerol phosphate synthase
MATGSDILDRIMQHKAQEVAHQKAKVLLNDLRAMADDTEPSRRFVNALQTSISEDRSAVIAEVKKASPSKGIIRPDFDPVRIADSYQNHGASCLSVLTDAEFFQGSADYFRSVRRVCDIPMLRKDFMLDDYQIFEARAMGADCILLIVAALEDGLMQDLAGRSIELGMDVLIEVHNAPELARGLQLNMPMIGINNRSLRTFETSLSNTTDLLESIPSDILVVTESGIHSAEDVELMRQHKVNSFLVGEAFMRADDPGQKMAELFF